MLWLVAFVVIAISVFIRWTIKQKNPADAIRSTNLQRRPTDEDLYTGLPFFDTFEESPFADADDYNWFIRQFQPVLTTAYCEYLKPGCVLCLDAVWRSPAPQGADQVIQPVPTFQPTSLRQLAENGLNFKFIEHEIYAALWTGYAEGLPSDYNKIFAYCKTLRDCGIFIGTTNLLREVVRRDCVMAYHMLIKAFGTSQTPGTTRGRIHFFTRLRQHVKVWGSIAIKRFYDEQINNPGHPTAASLFHEDERKTEMLWKTPPNRTTYPFQRQLRFTYCPYQAFNTTELRYACKNVSEHGWYEHSPHENLSALYVNPLDF